MKSATAVLMPRLGESVVEGTVARWLKAQGDSVAKLEPLLAISTDKIDTEIPAPAAGVLLQIRVAEGKTVAAGTVLAYIGAPEDTVGAPQDVTATPAPPPQAQSQSAPAASMQAIAAAALPTAHAAERPAGRAYISPVVKRLVAEHDVELEHVAGSGLGGRITKQDVLSYLEAHAGGEAHEPHAAQPDVRAQSDEIRHPLTSMRRAIAQHMVQSVQMSPHVATLFEADMTAVVRHREAHKDAFAARGIKLGYTPYLVVAAARALRAHPLLNSRYTDEAIVTTRGIHICVAVAVANGLLAPVLRNADEMTLAGVARGVQALTERARSGALLPDELVGGTFTITNHGVGGSLLGTPIINQPQAAILGVGAIVKRPVVRSLDASLLPSADDAIVIRPMCYLTLSFDHRLLDGADADAFMRTVVGALEGWGIED